MQSSYALFMIFYKARVAKHFSPDSENDLTSDSSDRLVEELRQGLQRIIEAMSNYSLAFEALDGMRGRIPFFSIQYRACLQIANYSQMKSKVHFTRRFLNLFN
jgi:hypothetical protein